ncbi:MAG: PKD domain-containing protein, partial [Cyanobacteria bacterium P01_F01_bin.150]
MSTTIFDPTLNLSNLDGSNGFVINGVGLADATANSVSSAGDINGDGIDDLIIGAYYSDGANDNSSVNQFFPEGKSYVVFGKNQIFNASLPLADLDGSNGFIINGVDWSDYSGVSVSGIGDFNGDGIDDLIIGAYKANGENNNFSDAGESYVVFGSTQGFSANLNLSSLDGSNGFVIYGIDEDDQSGISVSGIGDINQDGLSDLIIGTSGGDGVDNDVTDAGESYVVYGSQSPGSKLALSSLDGSNGFVIHGIDSNDFSGRSVAGAGDVNGDGVNDLIIGAPSADGIDNNTYKSGESYVIFGGILGSIVDLSSLDGNNGFTIYGIDEYDRSGSSVSGAGDVNGDGLSDLIIGAPRASDLDNGSINIGESYVVFGSDQPFSSELALSSLNGSNGFVIYGSNPSDYFGDSVAGAGDVNGDGLDDLIIGAPDANGENDNGFREGESAVIFGSRQNFPASLNLSSLNGNNGFIIYGASDQDESGSAVSGAGDINGDGIDDLIIGSPIADGDSIAAGQGNVVFGRSANDENTSATIGGRVWHDWNHNGLQDAFEPGIAGVEVEFIGTSDYTTFTDANGEYAFPLSSLTLQPSDYELFVHSYEIAFDADFTIPNVGNSSDIAPYGLQENDTYDSDMDDNPMSLSIESGQQLDIDLGIVSEIVSFYPDFNFDLSQSRIIEGDFVSVDLFVPNAVADNPLVIYEVDWGDGTTPEIFSYSLFQDSADIKHDYQQGGVYTVSITATDGEGDAVTQTQTILVDSIFPEFEIEAPFFQSENEPVRLNLLRQLPYFIRAEEEEIGITIDWDETIAITIDWGDGAVSSLDGSEAITPEHYYETSGDYEITVTATDEDGDTVTQRHFIQISAEFPEFDFHLPSLGQRNQEVSAYFSVLPGESDDGLQSESDVIYTLDWGNGEVQTFTSEDILAPHAYGEIFTPYTYQEDGYYTVTLTATDSDGDRTQQSQSILIGNTLPSDHGSEDGSTSSLLFRDHDRVFDGEPVRLRLDSRGAAPHHVTVNWGDGSAVESFYDVRNIPEHRYAQDGHYIVTVTATDKDGDRTTATSSVIVKPTFPDFRLDIFDRFSIENQPVYLEIDEQPVYWDINREELYESARYLSIDWGDGTILTHDYRAYGYWEHEYTNSGTYTITVTATDDDGDQSVRSQSVFINPSLPTFDLDDDVSINLGESYSPDIVTTNDEQTIYTVDWGDGTISEQSYYPPAHLYEDSGVYTLTVTATDEDGDRVVRSQSVFITAADGSEPNAPAFDFELSGSGYDDRTLSTLKDDVVNLDIYSTSNSNTTHIVDWGDGTGKKRLDYYTQDDSHVYTQDGQYQITVTAIDENGQTHTQTQTIAILSEPPAPFFRFSWLRQAYEEHFEPWRYPFFPEQREYKIAIESGEDAIYTIDWGDGTAPQVTQISDDNILPPAHAYARAGQYQVTVTATNDEGEISTQRQTINVISIDPRFVLHSRPSGENESVRLQLESLDHYRYDANLNVIYTVDWGDGSAIQSFSADELDTYGYGEIHKDNAYTNDGLYQITVTATDDDGDTYTQSYTHVVEAIAPEVTLSVPSTVTTGETFQPDIQQSGRDEAIAYSLNWGDGSEPTFSPSGSTIPEHRYTDAGIYTVQLTALDDDGDIVTQTQEIMVEAIAPTFDLDLPATELETTPVLLGLTPTFDASTPGSEADATITIDWGDGNTSILDGFDQSVPEHIYETGGHYTIVVTATDDDGESFRQEQFIYIISEFPDVDFALPNLGQVNQLITPDVTALHNEQGVTYTIDWGNGDTQTFADGELPQPYTYTEDGYYTVTLIAMDIDGDTVQQSQSILIGKTFPTPENTDTTSLPSFSTYLFDSSTEDESYTPYITYDGEEETVTFTIDWGDGTDSSFDYGSESVSSHVYTNDGFYTVMITATDDDGDQAVRSQVVEVSAKIPSFSTYLFDSSTEDESYTPYITYDGEEETVTFTIDWGDGTDSSF